MLMAHTLLWPLIFIHSQPHSCTIGLFTQTMELSNKIWVCGQIVKITGHFDWDLLSVLLWSHNFITLLRCGPWPLARAWAVRMKSDEEVAGSTSNLTPSSSSTKSECGFGQFVIYDLTAWKPLGILIQAGLSLSYWSQLSNKQLAHSSSSSSSGTIAMHWVEGLSKSFEASLVETLMLTYTWITYWS